MTFKEAIAYDAWKLQYESLKDGRIKTVKGYLSGQDVFVCSPTGSGKSLCFEIVPDVIDWVRFRPVEGENIVRTICGHRYCLKCMTKVWQQIASDRNARRKT